MITWLTRIIAGILIASLCAAIITEVFVHTLLSPAYLEHKADQTNTYVQLSNAISAELLKDSNIQNNPQVTSAIHQIVTPSLLRQKTNDALDQLNRYYTKGGLAPSIDLTSEVAQARALGLQIPADSPLNKPITLSANNASTETQTINKRFDGLRLINIVEIVVAVVALLALSWKRHRYAIIPDIAIVCGILLGIVAGIFSFLPSIFDKYVKFNFNSNDFAAVARTFAESVSRDLGKTFAVIAASLLVAGIVSRIFVGRMARPTTVTPTAK